MKTNHFRGFKDTFRDYGKGQLRLKTATAVCELADHSVHAKMPGFDIGNNFYNGHRGKAHAKAGLKKYLRTRVRFHENAELRKMLP